MAPRRAVAGSIVLRGAKAPHLTGRVSSNVRPHMNTPADLSSALQKLKGLTLSRVIFGPHQVQLDFSGEYNAFVEITRPFEVREAGTEVVESFNPSCASAQRAAMTIVALTKQVVERVVLQHSRWELGLNDGHVVTVSLEHGDFEPIIFSGAHHLSPGKLAWHYVVSSSSPPGEA